ncbi:MAG: haloacid dehalogenase type II [Rhizobiales bacterium]|nr:haloacid dehalogenase type II [Hyphomicrobiales bacterium]
MSKAAFAVYVFDAYGTLFDVHSATARERGRLGERADRLSELWRLKQLEYSWVRSLAGRHRDFWRLTEDALDFAAARLGGIDPATRTALLDAYRTLDAYADAAPALARLKAAGAATAILSNGSPAMLEAAVSSSRLGDLLDAALSIEQAGVFKTDPRAYALVGARFGVGPREVSFQSSNRWDIAGAAAFGFRPVWINRAGQPDEYADLPPARVVASLADVD